MIEMFLKDTLNWVGSYFKKWVRLKDQKYLFLLFTLRFKHSRVPGFGPGLSLRFIFGSFSLEVKSNKSHVFDVKWCLKWGPLSRSVHVFDILGALFRLSAAPEVKTSELLSLKASEWHRVSSGGWGEVEEEALVRSESEQSESSVGGDLLWDADENKNTRGVSWHYHRFSYNTFYTFLIVFVRLRFV